MNPIEEYEKEIIVRMYNHRIIGRKGYKTLQLVASIIKFHEIQRTYEVKKKFKDVAKSLIRKGLASDWGKSLKVLSLTRAGVDLARELLKETQ